MTPEQEQLLRDLAGKLAKLEKSDRYTFEKKIQLLEGINIQLDKTVGTQFGTEGFIDSNNEGQKLSFYGNTPVIQPATISDPSGGAVIDSQARSAIIAMLDLLQELGLMR